MSITLRRRPRAPFTALPKVRENQAVLDRFTEHVRQAGVSESEAIRQLLNAYLRWPFVMFTRPVDGPLDGHLAPVRVPQRLARAVQAQAAREGVSVGELVRRVVREQVRVRRGPGDDQLFAVPRRQEMTP